MLKRTLLSAVATLLVAFSFAQEREFSPADYVSPLVGTLSEFALSTGNTYPAIYIVGGGAKNTYLNGLTEAATGKKVIALPIEATAIGNLKVQTNSK